VSGVIDLYSTIISQRLENEQEIQTLLASKRMEQRIMNVMPFAMVLYLDITNPGYFAMLFHNLTGVVLMSICLIAYVTAYLWSEKIFSKTIG
jgi:tight adherence protein B